MRLGLGLEVIESDSPELLPCRLTFGSHIWLDHKARRHGVSQFVNQGIGKHILEGEREQQTTRRVRRIV